MDTANCKSKISLSFFSCSLKLFAIVVITLGGRNFFLGALELCGCPSVFCLCVCLSDVVVCACNQEHKHCIISQQAKKLSLYIDPVRRVTFFLSFPRLRPCVCRAAATGSSSRRGRRYSATANSFAACIRIVTQLPVHSKWPSKLQKEKKKRKIRAKNTKFDSSSRIYLIFSIWLTLVLNLSLIWGRNTFFCYRLVYFTTILLIYSFGGYICKETCTLACGDAI